MCRYTNNMIIILKEDNIHNIHILKKDHAPHHGSIVTQDYPSRALSVTEGFLRLRS